MASFCCPEDDSRNVVMPLFTNCVVTFEKMRCNKKVALQEIGAFLFGLADLPPSTYLRYLFFSACLFLFGCLCPPVSHA